MSISNYAEAKILDTLFNNTAFGAVANVYCKLHIGNPGEDCTGNPAANTTRQEATFGAASGGAIENDAAVTWTNVSNSETYSHFSLWDHSSAGNPLWYGTVTANPVTAGDTFTVATGDLDLTLD